MTHMTGLADPELPEDALAFAHQLFDGARSGDALLVVSAVEQGVPVNLTDENGNTLLMLASYHGHAGLVRTLLDQGADMERQNDRGQTPLAGAVFKRHGEVIEALIERGASVDAGTPSARATAEMFGVELPSGDA